MISDYNGVIGSDFVLFLRLFFIYLIIMIIFRWMIKWFDIIMVLEIV